MIGVHPLNVLYVFKATNCAACQAATPHIEAWRKKYGYRPTVVYLNVGLKDWEIAGFTPEATPTYLITQNGEVVAKYEGALTLEELDTWYTSALAGNPIEPAVDTDATEADPEDTAREPRRKPRKKRKG